MKKLNKILTFMFVIAVVAIITACGNTTTTKKFTVEFNTHGGVAVESIEVEENKTIELPTTSKEGYEFVGWFLEEEYVTEFTEDDKVTEDITLHAKFEEVEKETKIYVYTVSPREEFVLFENNKGEKQNKRTEFFDREQTYMVGDDNEWIVKPVVSFVELDVDGKVVDTQPQVDSWEYKVSLYVYSEDTKAYVAVEENEYVDRIDEVNCTVDFNENAIGKDFKVEIVPEGLSEKQQENVANYTVSFECSVADGYNAYTALDLAYYENRNKEGNTSDSGKEWVKFKEAKGLDVDYAPAAIFLHDNIEIKQQDLPGYFFYTKEEVAGAADAARAEGSLKDNKNIYIRLLDENKTFEFYGNYYTISAANLPVVVRENGEITEEGAVISHTTLFRLEAKELKDGTYAKNGSAEYANINFVGNAPRVEDAIKSGGLILNKTEGVTFNAYNNIAYAWFIIYMPNATNLPYTIDMCKGYDSYNSLLYNWGSPYFYVKNSEFVGAGGPVIIQDHINVTNADGGTPARTYVTNSKLESYVAGTEGWFYGVGAAAVVPGIKQLDLAFNPFGHSFLKTNKDKTVLYFNLICVNKSGSAETITAQKIKGSLKIDDNTAFDFGETNPYLAGMLDATFGKTAAFQTSKANLNNGIAYATESGLVDVTNTPIMDPTNGIFQGDYICIYYNGMALTVGYNTFSPTNGYEIHE